MALSVDPTFAYPDVTAAGGDCPDNLVTLPLSSQPARVASENDELLGRCLAGKFVLQELIGTGASGRVYRAEQISLQREVAVKVLRPELAGDDDFVRRFAVEAYAASRLSHPNTVAVHDYGTDAEGNLFIAMEFIPGETLTSLIRRERPLDVERVVALIGQILSALEEAHAAGIVHADLKCDNILVDRLRDGQEVARVVDFGIARLMQRARDRDLDDTDSRSDTMSGTPNYMAPEVIRGEAPGRAADIYAAGIVLYEALTGTTPFLGEALMDILVAQVRDPVEPPSQRRLDLGRYDGLDELVLRALAKDPADRFPSAAAFKLALTEVIDAHCQVECTVDEVHCDGCGTWCDAQFKFCPECGVTLADLEPATLEAVAPTLTAASLQSELEDCEAGFDRRERVAAAMARFVAGQGRMPVLVVTGGSAVAMSQLVDEVVRTTAAGGPAHIAGRALGELPMPWEPVRSLCAEILAVPFNASPAELAQAAMDEGLEAELGGLTTLFGHGVTRGTTSDAHRVEAVTAAVQAVLTAAARTDEGATIVFENADRYDGASREILESLIAASLGARIRVLLTAGAPFFSRCSFSLPALSLTESGEREVSSESVLDILEVLDEDERVVLEAAAACGDAVAAEQLAAVLGEELEVEAARDAGQRLAARGLLIELDGYHHFFDPGVRQVVYSRMPRLVRRARHRRVAEWLSEAPTGERARHLELSGCVTEARAAWLAAGRLARACRDFEGAATCFRGALRCARCEVSSELSEPRLHACRRIALELAETLVQAGDVEGARGLVEEAGAWDGLIEDDPAYVSSLQRLRVAL